MEAMHRDRKRKLLEVLVKPFKLRQTDKNKTRTLESVNGNFSLREIRGAKFPGRQTAATALCALLQAKSLSPASWSPEVIDRLLLQGDKLHTTRLRDLDRLKTGNGELKPEELPIQFCSRHTEFTVSVKTFSTDSFILKKMPSSSLDHRIHIRNSALQTWLRRGLQDHCGMLLTTHGSTFTILKSNERYYLFHPSLEMRKRVFGVSHQAVLRSFQDVAHMCSYIGNSLIPEDAPYSLFSVDIQAEVDKWASFTLSQMSLYV